MHVFALTARPIFRTLACSATQPANVGNIAPEIGWRRAMERCWLTIKPSCDGTVGALDLLGNDQDIPSQSFPLILAS